jgi:hypothetical protein
MERAQSIEARRGHRSLRAVRQREEQSKLMRNPTRRLIDDHSVQYKMNIPI